MKSWTEPPLNFLTLLSLLEFHAYAIYVIALSLYSFEKSTHDLCWKFRVSQSSIEYAFEFSYTFNKIFLPKIEKMQTSAL